MAKKITVLMGIAPIGKRRAVVLGRLPDGRYILEFIRPIDKSDYKNGSLVPQSISIRHKNQIITQIYISKEAIRALRKLTKKMVKRPSITESFEKQFEDFSSYIMQTLAIMEKR